LLAAASFTSGPKPATKTTFNPEMDTHQSPLCTH